MFSLRIVTVDHYQGTPVNGLDPQYSTFRGAPVKRVPVLRIFGATPAGQKACLHVHGVFPYILIPYDGAESLSRLPYILAAALDKALNIALGNANSNAQHVYKVQPVSGIPFYGYHAKEHQFLKIFFYSPVIVKKAAELLQNGVINNKIYQPHEAHVPYVLQFLMDHNLHGMNMIHLGTCKFRRKKEMGDIKESARNTPEVFPGPSSADTVSHESLGSSSSQIKPSTKVWTEESIPQHLWLPETVSRSTTCEVEVDALFSDIINKIQLGAGNVTNPGLSYIWEDELQRCKTRGQAVEDLKPPDSPPRSNITPSDSELFYRSVLKEKTAALLKKMKDGEGEEAGVSLAAVTPDDSVLAPATAPDTSVLADVSTLNQEPDLDGDRSDQVDVEASQVDEELIQNLTQQTPSQWMDVSDVDLLNVMAGLADGSQIISPEDNDAILSTQRPSGSCGTNEATLQTQSSEGREKEEESDEDETRHMTQRIWDSILPAKEEEEEEEKEKEEEEGENNDRQKSSTHKDSLRDQSLLREDKDIEDLVEGPGCSLPQLDGAIDCVRLLKSEARTKECALRETFVPSGSAQTVERNTVIMNIAQNCDSKVLSKHCDNFLSGNKQKCDREKSENKEAISLKRKNLPRTREVDSKKRIERKSSSETSDEEVFIIPQFDGANDIVFHSRKQKTSSNSSAQHAGQGSLSQRPSLPQMQYTSNSKSINAREAIRENILKKKRGVVGEVSQVVHPTQHRRQDPQVQQQRQRCNSQPVPYPSAPQAPVPSSHNNRVPASMSSSVPSDINMDRMLGRRMETSSNMASGQFMQSSTAAREENYMRSNVRNQFSVKTDSMGHTDRREGNIASGVSQGFQRVSQSQERSKSSKKNRKGQRSEFRDPGVPSHVSSKNSDSMGMAGPLNITPIASGMPQEFPGIGKALVVPALVTNKRVNVTNSQVMLSPNLVMQNSGNVIFNQSSYESGSSQQSPNVMMVQPTIEQENSGGRRHAQINNPLRHTTESSDRSSSKSASSSSGSFRASRSSKYAEGGHQGFSGSNLAGAPGPLKSIMRQHSDQSVYSPISDESDIEISSTKNAVAPKSSETAGERSSKQSDILQQALQVLDMSLDIDIEPMDNENCSVQKESPSTTSSQSRPSPVGRHSRASNQNQQSMSHSMSDSAKAGGAEGSSSRFENSKWSSQESDGKSGTGSWERRSHHSKTNQSKPTTHGEHSSYARDMEGRHLSQKVRGKPSQSDVQNIKRSEREAKATPTGQTLRTNEVSDSSSSSQSESGSERQSDSDSSRSSSPDSGVRAQKLQAVRDRHMTTPVTQSRRFSRVASTDVFDMDYDMTPQTPGSDLPVHDPVTNPAVGVLNQVPRPHKNKPSHAATSSKKSESAMPHRKMSDCDNPEWFNFDCPPTPGDPVSSKHGFSEPSSVVQKTEAKKGNKRQTSARAQSSSGETAQVSNGSSESKRKSKKKMDRLFGSFSPPASSSGSTPTQEEGLQVTNIKPVTVEPFVDTFDSDDDNKTPERPQTPGREVRDDHTFRTPASSQKQHSHDYFYDYYMNNFPERPLTPGGNDEVQNIFSNDSGDDVARNPYQQFESIFDPDLMASSLPERPRTPGGGSSPTSMCPSLSQPSDISSLYLPDQQFKSPGHARINLFPASPVPVEPEPVVKKSPKTQRFPSKSNLPKHSSQISHSSHDHPPSDRKEHEKKESYSTLESGLSPKGTQFSSRNRASKEEKKALSLSKSAVKSMDSSPFIGLGKVPAPLSPLREPPTSKSKVEVESRSRYPSEQKRQARQNVHGRAGVEVETISEQQNIPHSRKGEEELGHGVEYGEMQKSKKSKANLESMKHRGRSAMHHAFSEVSEDQGKEDSRRKNQPFQKTALEGETADDRMHVNVLRSEGAHRPSNQQAASLAHRKDRNFPRPSSQAGSHYHTPQGGHQHHPDTRSPPRSRYQQHMDNKHAQHGSRFRQSGSGGRTPSAENLPQQSNITEVSPGRHRPKLSQWNRQQVSPGNKQGPPQANRSLSGNRQPPPQVERSQISSSNRAQSSQGSKSQVSPNNKQQFSQAKRQQMAPGNQRHQPQDTHSQAHVQSSSSRWSKPHNYNKAAETSSQQVTEEVDFSPHPDVSSQQGKKVHRTDAQFVPPQRLRQVQDTSTKDNTKSGWNKTEISSGFKSGRPVERKEPQPFRREKSAGEEMTKMRSLKSIPSLASTFCKAKAPGRETNLRSQEFPHKKGSGFTNIPERREEKKDGRDILDQDDFNLPFIDTSLPLMSPIPCTPAAHRDDFCSVSDSGNNAFPLMESIQPPMSPMAPTPRHQPHDDINLRLQPLSPVEPTVNLSASMTPQSNAPFILPMAPGPVMSPIPPTPVRTTSPVRMSPMPVYPSMLGPIVSPLANTPTHSIGESFSILSPVPSNEDMSSHHSHPFGSLREAAEHFTVQAAISPMPQTPAHIAQMPQQLPLVKNPTTTAQTPAMSPIPPTPSYSETDDFPLPPMMSPMPVYPSVGPLVSPMPHTPSHYGVESNEPPMMSPLPSLPSAPGPVMSPLPQTPSYAPQTYVSQSPLYMPYTPHAHAPQTPLHTPEASVHNPETSGPSDTTSTHAIASSPRVQSESSAQQTNTSPVQATESHKQKLQQTAHQSPKDRSQFDEDSHLKSGTLEHHPEPKTFSSNTQAITGSQTPVTPHPPHSVSPLHAPLTPLHGPITPLHGPITPLHGPMTPLQGPMTPLQGPMTPLQGPMTPLHVPMTPLQAPLTPLTPLTPVPSAQTPHTPPATSDSLQSQEHTLHKASQDLESKGSFQLKSPSESMGYDGQYSPMPVLPSVPGPVMSPMPQTPVHIPQTPPSVSSIILQSGRQSVNLTDADRKSPTCTMPVTPKNSEALSPCLEGMIDPGINTTKAMINQGVSNFSVEYSVSDQSGVAKVGSPPVFATESVATTTSNPPSEGKDMMSTKLYPTLCIPCLQ
ncbi:mucin-4-like [Penaeus chinensis]|uniref:mucin-4-like n=1 Tax=Penaeus chinensis TaxID=139456 RepID=UPI001FB681D1|nr:mucin-4-like [Penaeus chinensis]